MIQRTQSIWLLLAAITILCLLIVPVLTTNSGNISYSLFGTGFKQFSNGVETATTNVALLVSTVLAGLISFANIFNFKNRTLQKRVATLNIVLILALSFWFSNLGKQLPGGIENATINAGLFLPLVAIICTLLALRGIKNDEKLIRSADRLR